MRSSNLLVVTLFAFLFSNSLVQAQSLTTFAIEPTQGKSPEAYLAVFVDGNLRDVLGNGDEAQGQTASGSIGVLRAGRNSITNLLVNAAGTSVSLTSNYGAAMLAPATGGSLGAGLLDVRLFPGGKAVGLHFYGAISSSTWEAPEVDTTATRENIGAVVAGGGFGASVQLFSKKISDGSASESRPSEQVAGILDVGLVTRGLLGDVSDGNNDALRESLLSTKRTAFIGLEIGLSLQVRNLKAALQYYGFSGDTPGLTDGQVVAGLSVEAPLIIL